ncbi:preprotein translocase subunit SecY, partial [Bacillus cereus]|nr:preprotein translocase subunit SecY [Bacillus cereus]
PSDISQVYHRNFENIGDQLFMSIAKIALILLAALAIIVSGIFLQPAFRKISIQYAKRGTGGHGGAAGA